MIALASAPIHFVDAPEFHLPEAEAVILAPAPVGGLQGEQIPAGLSAYRRSLYAVPLLTAAQEAHYFRQMNYLKFKASELPADSTERAELLQRAQDLRDLIIRSNLRLVVAFAKRTSRGGDDFDEALSNGHLSLMLVVEGFDFTQGFRFSTYATTALHRNQSRRLQQERSLAARFRSTYRDDGDRDFLSEVADTRQAGNDEKVNLRQRAALESILASLPDRERRILRARFGLDGAAQVLAEIGRNFGITKERVRQLATRAIKRLRAKVGSIDVAGLKS